MNSSFLAPLLLEELELMRMQRHVLVGRSAQDRVVVTATSFTTVDGSQGRVQVRWIGVSTPHTNIHSPHDRIVEVGQHSNSPVQSSSELIGFIWVLFGAILV